MQTEGSGWICRNQVLTYQVRCRAMHERYLHEREHAQQEAWLEDKIRKRVL